MKIRLGFVSNSSSTSFCIIGTDNEKDIKALMKAEGFPEDIHNSETCSCDEGFWNLHEVRVDDTIHKYKPTKFCYIGSNDAGPDIVGIEVEELLQDNSIREAAKIVVKIAAELGVEISEANVGLAYGTAYS